MEKKDTPKTNLIPDLTVPPEQADTSPAPDRMLKWFEYEHLENGPTRDASRMFEGLARVIVTAIRAGPERTVALRKLLEAKDAAVRATVHPGG